MRYLAMFIMVLLSAASARADEILPDDADALCEVQTEPVSQEQEFANQVDDEALDEYRGAGTPQIYNLSSLTGMLNNTSANNTVSGANVLEDGALTQVSGITSVIQNSGNNVIIQSSTTVNLTMN